MTSLETSSEARGKDPYTLSREMELRLQSPRLETRLNYTNRNAIRNYGDGSIKEHTFNYRFTKFVSILDRITSGRGRGEERYNR